MKSPPTSRATIRHEPRPSRASFGNIAAASEAARLRPELGDGVRLSVFRNYVALYVVHDDFLEVRRVVHGARNLADID
jgi:plasmid stabilization system protein ParE